MRIRPLTNGTTNPSQYLISLTLPTTGPISGTTNLGIVWANPADHTQQLDSSKFNFTNGFGYFSVNALSSFGASQYINAGFGFLHPNPVVNLQFFLVDQNGVDQYSLGQFNSIEQAALGVNQYNMISIGASGGSAVGNGIRGQVTVTAGTFTIVIPSPWLFLSRSAF